MSLATANCANALKRLSFLTLACVPITVPCEAAETSEPSHFTLEEVVVTANKRAESIQSTAITITAFSADDLVNRGLDDFEKYAQFVPGLDFQKGGVSQSQYVIRGATIGRVNPAEPQNRSLVGLYLNDIPLDMNGLNPDVDLFDTRVEVLKGPQGSLYGDSAMAGAIRYVTNEVDLSRVSARLLTNAASISSGGMDYNVKGMVNLPISDELGVRLVGVRRDSDGWTDNVLLGDEDTNSARLTAFRGSVRYAPTSEVTLDLMYLHQRTHAGTPPYDTDAIGTDGLGGNAQFSRQTNESLRDSLDLVGLTANVKFSWGSLTSVTSYNERDIDNRLVELADALSLFYFNQLPDPLLTHNWRTDRFTQELRVATDLPGRVNATAGVYYSDQKINFYNLGTVPGLEAFALREDLFGLAPDLATYKSLGCADLTDTWYCGPEIDKTRQYALFGEVYVDLSDRWRVTAGGRWYDYRLDYFQDFGGIINFGRFTKQSRTDDNGFNPKLGLSFKATEDVLVYANAAKGYRLGGVSNALPAFCDADLAGLGLTGEDVDSYDADELWSYELGMKTATPDRRLTINGALYYTRWSDIQTPINLSCGYIPTTNAGEVQSKGAEMQIAWALTDGVVLNFGAAYNDSTLQGEAPALGATDGDRAPYAPKFKGVAGIDVTRPLSSTVTLVSSLDAKYTTEAYDTFTEDNEIPAQFLGNFRLGGLFRERYRLSLFVDNLTNEEVVTNIRSRFGLTSRYVGRPRTVGLELSADFN